MNQKGISSIVIILIIVGVLVAVGGIYWWQVPINYWFKNPTNFEECKEATRGNIIKTKPPQCEFRDKNFTETTDETADWKTYRNEKYGFEVKYPNDLNAVASSEGGSISISIQQGSDIYKSPRLYGITAGVVESGLIMIDGVEKSAADLSQKEIISTGLQLRKCNPANFDTFIDWISISTGGIKGVKATVKNNDSCLQKYLPWVAFKKDNKIYQLQFLRGTKEEFNQILSTFKFIK